MQSFVRKNQESTVAKCHMLTTDRALWLRIRQSDLIGLCGYVAASLI